MTDEIKRAAAFQTDPRWAAEMLGVSVIQGMKFVCQMPDAGPWKMVRWKMAGVTDALLLVSEISGPWRLDDGEFELVKIEPMFEPKERAMSHMEEVERRSATLYKAPRVSLDDIKANIKMRYDFTAAEALEGMAGNGATFARNAPEVLLSICLLVTQNGFTIIGKSARASPENFDREYGKQLAYEDAVKQLWPLMGYALREKLWCETSAEG